MAMTQEEVLQEAYARWLDTGTRLAFAASLLVFVLYAGGVVPSYVPLETLPDLWGLSVDQYLERTGAPAGWAWLTLIAFSDYASLACIALIGLVTVLCYLAILPMLLRLGDRLQAGLVMAQAIVLLIAASGVLAGGH
jgi:hypothetical protein